MLRYGLYLRLLWLLSLEGVCLTPKASGKNQKSDPHLLYTMHIKLEEKTNGTATIWAVRDFRSPSVVNVWLKRAAHIVERNFI